MSKFIQLEKSPNVQYATMLNLDHVAKVNVSPELTFGTTPSQKVHISLHSVEGQELTKLHFENREAANRWVLQHLGVEL